MALEVAVTSMSVPSRAPVRLLGEPDLLNAIFGSTGTIRTSFDNPDRYDSIRDVSATGPYVPSGRVAKTIQSVIV